MLQEALILALFTLRYIQHCYSSLEIQNAFKKPTIKPWFFTLQRCWSFQIASEWLPSNTVLCVIIQRLKLSRNPSNCGVCCIAFRRTSSPGEEAAPLTRRGGPWAAAPFPPPGPFWQSSDNCPHFCNPRGTFTPHLHLWTPQLEQLLHKTQRGQYWVSPWGHWRCQQRKGMGRSWSKKC